MVIPADRTRSVLEVEELGPRGWKTNLVRAQGHTVRLELRALSGDLSVPAVLDGLVAATLPFAMTDQATLFVNGPLTRGALRNFTEFAEAWHSWNPTRFHRLHIHAATIVDGRSYRGPHQAVAAWSGSLRSTHTLIRHATGMVPGAFVLHSALRVIGLHPGDEATGLEPARRALAALGLPLSIVQVYTDAPRLLDPEIGALPWVASALHAVAGGERIGLHARSRRCTATQYYPRPGPDLPDCLSGDTQPVRADGGAASPPRMARDLQPHPALTALVSNCHRNPRHQPPCGICPNCTLLKLAFTACGAPQPAQRHPPNCLKIATLPLGNPVWLDDARSTLNDWTARSTTRQCALSARCAIADKAARAGETARWLAALVGRHRPWPR